MVISAALLGLMVYWASKSRVLQQKYRIKLCIIMKMSVELTPNLPLQFQNHEKFLVV